MVVLAIRDSCASRVACCCCVEDCLDSIAKLLLPLSLCLQTVVEKKIAKEQGVTRHQLGQWMNDIDYLASYIRCYSMTCQVVMHVGCHHCRLQTDA
jgi:hypothetical protein